MPTIRDTPMAELRLDVPIDDLAVLDAFSLPGGAHQSALAGRIP